MPKIAARNASLNIHDNTAASFAMSALTNNITLDFSAEAPETTGFGSNTKERLAGGITDWELNMDGFWGSGASETDSILFGLVGGSGTFVSFGPAGSGAGAVKYTACAILTKYNIKLGTNDAAQISSTFTGRSGSLTRATWP